MPEREYFEDDSPFSAPGGTSYSRSGGNTYEEYMRRRAIEHRNGFLKGVVLPVGIAVTGGLAAGALGGGAAAAGSAGAGAAGSTSAASSLAPSFLGANVAQGLAPAFGGAATTGAGVAGGGAAAAAAGGSMPGWVMPTISGAGQVLGFLGDRSRSKADREAQLEIENRRDKRERDLADLDARLTESGRNPFSHVLAQLEAAALLDKLANTRPLTITPGSETRYTRAIPQTPYETSPELRAAADTMRTNVLGGGGANQSVVGAPNGRPAAAPIDILSLVAAATGARNGKMPVPMPGGGGAPQDPMVPTFGGGNGTADVGPRVRLDGVSDPGVVGPQPQVSQRRPPRRRRPAGRRMDPMAMSFVA